MVGGPGLPSELVELAPLGDGGCFGDVAVDAVPAQAVGEGFGDDAVDHADGSCRQVRGRERRVTGVAALAADGAGDGMSSDVIRAEMTFSPEPLSDGGCGPSGVIGSSMRASVTGVCRRRRSIGGGNRSWGLSLIA